MTHNTQRRGGGGILPKTCAGFSGVNVREQKQSPSHCWFGCSGGFPFTLKNQGSNPHQTKPPMGVWDLTVGFNNRKETLMLGACQGQTGIWRQKMRPTSWFLTDPKWSEADVLLKMQTCDPPCDHFGTSVCHSPIKAQPPLARSPRTGKDTMVSDSYA